MSSKTITQLNNLVKKSTMLLIPSENTDTKYVYMGELLIGRLTNGRPEMFHFYSEVVPALSPEFHAIYGPHYYSEFLPFELSEILLDILNEQTFPPQVTFGNGNIRQTFIRNLVTRLNNEGNTSIVAKMRLNQLKDHVDKLSDSQKEMLKQYVDMDTLEVIQKIYCYKVSLNSSGTIQCYLDYHNINNLTLVDSNITGAAYGDRHTPFYVNAATLENFQGNTTTVKVEQGRTQTTVEATPFEMELLRQRCTQCSQCGAWTREGNLIFNMCHTCVGDFPRELRGYSERATSFFQPAPTKGKFSDRLTGCELEYEFGNGREQTLFFLHRNLKDHAIFKRDGSLNDGVEICTRPASVNEHLTQFQKMFEDTQCMGSLRVQSTCGMHVHIDKQKLTALTLGKLVSFMQSSHNKDFIKLIAGRATNNYAKTGTDHTVTSIHRGLLTDRYNGVNNNNRATIELRVFKTPNDFAVFERNMEFVDAISAFIQPGNSGVKETTWEMFHKFVASQRSTYRNLNQFLKTNL